MESAQFVKGYDRLNLSDDLPIHGPRRRRPRIIITASLLISLSLVLASVIIVLIHYSFKESKPSQLASNSIESLRTVCAVTRYPDSCFSSISPLNSPLAAASNSPFRFFNLSLQASQLEISSLRKLTAKPTSEPALKDCAELFDDAASQLGKSAESIRVGPGEKVLTDVRVSDLQTWISAAMTDQDTCLHGVAEMGSTALGELKNRVQKSQEYMSNTLAILKNMKSLSVKFGLTTP